MRKSTTLVAAAFMVFATAACESEQPTSPGVEVSEHGAFAKGDAGGFDKYGYNRGARIFVGPADGVDKILDGKIYGDPTFANDHLVMKWNADWDRGNAEKWLNPPYDAWTSNEWNGKRPNGTDYTEHFKTKWSATCVAGLPLTSGGWCIWGQFEVLMDHGTAPGGGHEWWTKAMPNGYGR